MRPIQRRWCPIAGLATLAGLLAACGSSPPPAPQVNLDDSPFAVFSADRAWADLEALAALGPRPPGSDASRAAREYLRAGLLEAGLTVQEVPTEHRFEIEGEEPLEIDLRHLVGTLPGASPDLFVLMAPYDSGTYEGVDFVGVNQGASGAALVLELSRVLAQHDQPYTMRVVFLDGEGRLGRGGEKLADVRGLGSEAYAQLVEDAGELDRIRLLVAFDRVCDADLRIARDLVSHRMHREEFWKAAARLGRSAAFPPGVRFQSPVAPHLAFQRRDVRPVVAIVDTSFGGEESPGVYAETSEDSLAHCAPESLETVGLVTLEALETIGARLSKIDRFSRRPVTEVDVLPPPAPAAAPPAPDAQDAAEEGGAEPDASEPATASPAS